MQSELTDDISCIISELQFYVQWCAASFSLTWFTFMLSLGCCWWRPNMQDMCISCIWRNRSQTIELTGPKS